VQYAFRYPTYLRILDLCLEDNMHLISVGRTRIY
jgi:hypothetical protein